jgi:hypothetical protein
MPSKSKSQQRFMGMVHAYKKGELKNASADVKKAAKSMSKKDTKDFASTKHKGKPEKVKQETKVRSLIRKMVREMMAEDFGGALPKHKQKKFDNMRRKQSEVLGYKLTGKNDIKSEIGNVDKKEYQAHFKAIKEGKINEVNFDKVVIPGKVKRFLDRFVDSMKDAQLNRIRRSAILYKVIQASGMDTKTLMADIQKIKRGLSKEGKLSESQQVAKTILQQLGGNRFIAMTGAKNFGSSKNSLQFKIGRNSKSISHVIITLKSSDLYDVEFIRMRGVNRKVVKKLKGVYADQLGTMFKKYTGMNVRL